MALREVELRDWWRVIARELPSGIMLGCILGAIGMIRIDVAVDVQPRHRTRHNYNVKHAVTMTARDAGADPSARGRS